MSLILLLSPTLALTADLSLWQQQAAEVMARLWSAMEPPARVAGRPEVRVVDDDAINAHIRIGRPSQSAMSGESPDLRQGDAATGDQPPASVIAGHGDRGPYTASCSAELLLCRGLIERLLVEDGRADVDALAGVMGHELGHLALGHHNSALREGRERLRQHDVILGISATREEEFAADLYGMKLAGQAGYDPHGLIRAFQRGRELLGDGGSWETAGADHPTFTQRLEVIDQEKAGLWRAALDFEVGVDLLRAGNYACAQECFQGALRMFPDAPEVLCNLGYALLMEYYHKLPPEYWAAHDIGQPLPVGFATFLPVAPRRSRSGAELDALRRQWQEAVGYLEQARQRQPNYTLALGNLGFAYLAAPDGPQVEKAQKYLEQAGNATQQPTPATALPGPRLLDAISCSVSNDLAIVARLQGRRQEALSLLQGVATSSSCPNGHPQSISPLLSDAPVVNLCVLLADSPRAEDQQKAASDLERLLSRYPAASAEWQYAYNKYLALCNKLGRHPLPEEKLSAPRPHMLAPYLLWKGAKIYLEDSATRLWSLLGKPEVSIGVGAATSPLPPGKGGQGGRPALPSPPTPLPQAEGSTAFPLPLGKGGQEGTQTPAIYCWRYGEAGLELTFLRSTLVRARVTRAAKENPCQVVIPLEGKQGAVRVGDPVAKLDRLLGFSYDDAVRLGDSRPYRLYSSARLAVLVEEGVIRALAVVGARG